MCVRQLFLVGYYFLSNMAALVVTFRLKVDVFDSFEEVQTKLKE